MNDYQARTQRFPLALQQIAPCHTATGKMCREINSIIILTNNSPLSSIPSTLHHLLFQGKTESKNREMKSRYPPFFTNKLPGYNSEKPL